MSKAAIRDEFGSRLAEFAPPGEQLQGLFSNTPTRTLGTVPRQAICFRPPDHGISHFSVRAQMRDQQGRLHRIRLRIAQKWRVEATALTAAASGSQPGYGAPEPGSGY